MKINLELNILDERMFLYFWNWYNGDDLVCQIKEGKLMLFQHDEDLNELPSKEITFIEFCEMVKTRMEKVFKETK